MTVPSRDCARCAALETRLRQREAQNRRDVDDLNEAELNARVYRRALERTIRDRDALAVENERLRQRLEAATEEAATERRDDG